MGHLSRPANRQAASSAASVASFTLSRQSFQQSSADSFQRAFVVVDGRSRVLTRNQNQVESDWQVVPDVAEGFAHQAFETASFDGVAVLFRDAQTATCFTEIVPRGEDQQVIVAGADLTVVDVAKLRGLAELRRFRK